MNAQLVSETVEQTQITLITDFSDKTRDRLKTELQRITIEALPRASGWAINVLGEYPAPMGFLHRSDGWTQTLVDQLVRVVNEGMPL